jgi:hypothetical protein
MAICQSSRCVNGVCVGAELHGACLDPFGCNPGLFCNATLAVPICEKPNKAGNFCGKPNYDLACENGSLCLNGLCTKQFSLDDGAKVTDCATQGTLCKSGACYDNLCVRVPYSEKSVPMQCEDNDS